VSVIILRIEGEHLDVDTCLRWFPAAELQNRWDAEELSRGQKSRTSGFAVLLAEGEDMRLLLVAMAASLRKLSHGIASCVCKMEQSRKWMWDSL
jgi:hypothetical protein